MQGIDPHNQSPTVISDPANNTASEHLGVGPVARAKFTRQANQRQARARRCRAEMHETSERNLRTTELLAVTRGAPQIQR